MALPPQLSAGRNVDSAFGVGLPGFPGAPSFGGFNPLGPVEDLLSSGRELAALVTFIVDPHNWLRLAEAIAGGTLILIGIVAVLWDTKAGEAVRQEVGPMVAAGAKTAAAL